MEKLSVGKRQSLIAMVLYVPKKQHFWTLLFASLTGWCNLILDFEVVALICIVSVN